MWRLPSWWLHIAFLPYCSTLSSRRHRALNPKRHAGKRTAASGLAGERAKLTNTAFAGGNHALCLQNRRARCVLVARWHAVTCCTAAAMSAAEDRICPFSMPSSCSFLLISLSITCWSPVKEKLQFLAFCMGGLRVKWNLFPSLAKCSIAFPPLIVEYSGRLIKESLLATY